MVPNSTLTRAEKEVLELFQKLDQPFVTTRDLRGEFGISQQAAYNRLQGLEEKGILMEEKVGARAAVWWKPDNQLEV